MKDAAKLGRQRHHLLRQDMANLDLVALRVWKHVEPMLENYWPAIACLFLWGGIGFFARKKAFKFGSNICNTSTRELWGLVPQTLVARWHFNVRLMNSRTYVFRHGKDEKVLPAMPQVDERTQARLCSCANSFLQPSTSISGAWKTGIDWEFWDPWNPGTSRGIWFDCWLFMLKLNLRQFCSKGCVLWSYSVG